jgi:hypothetical protein
MCAFYPRTEDLPGLEDTGIDEFLRTMRRETTFLMWLGVLAGTFVYYCSPIITIYVPLPAFFLSRRLRDKHAYALGTHPIYLVRQTAMLVKLPAGLCWGRDAKVRAKFALPPLPPDPDTWRTT